VNGVILHKGDQFYTFLKPIFEAIQDAQINYNWLVTECGEWEAIFRKYDCVYYEEYVWICGKELTKLIRENANCQMVWGVLSGFDTKYTLKEILKYPKPYADMNRKLWENPITIQNPLATIEIVAFDSSCTLIKCADKKMLDGVRQKFPYCEDLELYNSGSNDNNVANEQWLINNGK